MLAHSTPLIIPPHPDLFAVLLELTTNSFSSFIRYLIQTLLFINTMHFTHHQAHAVILLLIEWLSIFMVVCIICIFMVYVLCLS